MGWRPETGFISTRWDHYSELMMLYLLAIGSPTHPIPPDSWNAFTRPPMTFGPYTYISGSDPLFVHQYSHAWFDFARQRDAYADYFANSIIATRAHKAFCLSLKRGYTDDYWGVSASDWEHGYTAWGGPRSWAPSTAPSFPAPPPDRFPSSPATAFASSVLFATTSAKTPGAATASAMPSTPSLHWYDTDVLGIDLGIGLLMAENLRTGFVWETFMQNPEPVAAMKACGFHSDRQNQPPPNPRPTPLSLNRPSLQQFQQPSLIQHRHAQRCSLVQLRPASSPATT